MDQSLSEPAAPLQPGDRAPNVVLDAVTREGKIAIDDYRGQQPVLIGLFRGLHCPFCRRHIAALDRLAPDLRSQGIELLTVVNTPIERARMYLRYRPFPNIFAASDPERLSHRAFGLPNTQWTENETVWPYKIGMDMAAGMRINPGNELPEAMAPNEAAEIMNRKDGYEMLEADLKMQATGGAQLVGQFLLDRDGIVRWTFSEVPEGGRYMFGGPTPQEVMTAASRVVN
jgi:peroxiredoxin